MVESAAIALADGTVFYVERWGSAVSMAAADTALRWTFYLCAPVMASPTAKAQPERRYMCPSGPLAFYRVAGQVRPAGKNTVAEVPRQPAKYRQPRRCEQTF